MTGHPAPDERHALAALTGPEVRDLLAGALGTVGLEPAEHRRAAVHHRPGVGVSVGYEVLARAGDGSVRAEYVVLTSAPVPAGAAGVVTLAGGGLVVSAWRHPGDPALPGLAAACDPQRLSAFLGDEPLTGLVMLGYRPLRRAVLRATRPGGVSYVKVLRPAAAGGPRGTAARLRLMRAAGVPVPRLRAASHAGVLALDPVGGTPLLAALLDPAAPPPALADLVGPLDALPAELLAMPRRPSWSQRAAHYARAVVVAAPHLAAPAAGVARAVADGLESTDAGPVVPTHGDFYEAQLTVARGPAGWHVAGLLDVDDAGPGHRVDDVACLLAHLAAIAPDDGGGRLAETVALWTGQAGGLVDPDALRVRVAGALLSLAASALHLAGAAQAEARLDAAAAWLAGVPAQPVSR